MSETDLLRRIEALEEKVQELEEMLNLIVDIQKSERMQTAIEKKKKAVAFSTLINTLTNESSIDVNLQKQAIDEIEEEKKQTDERISESLNHSPYDIDITDYESLFSYEIIRWGYSDVSEITGYLGFESERLTKLIIPEAIDGYKVVSVGKKAFSKCNFEEVYLPESVERIQEGAFEDCKKLRYINLPHRLTSLGRSCFRFCKSLNILSLPKSLTTIGDYCFFGTGLVSITIPQKIKFIPSSCFCSCKSLNEVYLPEELQDIENRAFCGTKISEIIIPSSIPKLRINSFEDTIGHLVLKDPLSIVVLGNQTEIDCYGIKSNSRSLITIYCNPGSRAIQDARKAEVIVKPLSQFAKEHHHV